MMHKILALLISVTCGFQFVLLASALFSIAHQAITQQSSAHQANSSETVNATIHLDPDDRPRAGQPSLTWFLLTQPNGDIISPSTCLCEVTVYNATDEAIAHDLPLSSIELEGHQAKGHQAISTMITFPAPGDYTVVLSGQSKDGSFDMFILEFPVTAVSL